MEDIAFMILLGYHSLKNRSDMIVFTLLALPIFQER